MRTKAFAIFAANGFERNGQQNLLPNHVLKQQPFPLIITDFGFGASHRHLFAPCVHSQGAIKEVKSSLHIFYNWFQAAGAGHIQLSGKLPVNPYVFYCLMFAVMFLDQLGATGGVQCGALLKIRAQVDGPRRELLIEVHRLAF